MENVFLGFSPEQWIEIGLSVLIVALALLLGRKIVNIVLERGVGQVVRRTGTALDDALLQAVCGPLHFLLILLAADVALQRLDFLPLRDAAWVDNSFYVLYFLVGFVFVWRFLSNFFTWYGQEMAARTQTDLDKQLLPFFRRIAFILLTGIALAMLLGHFNVDVSAMVTTLGIGSLAVALAAQSALTDTISGFLIILDRPFRIGDRIEILDLDTWGDVVDIGLRSSRIRTRDNRMVIIPNSLIGKSMVVNYSYPNEAYRLQVEVGVAYGTDLEKARQTIIEAVRGVENVARDRPVEALFLQFGASALIFRVRWWLDSYVETRRMFDRVNTAIYNALNRAGIEIAYPQLDVHHKIDAENATRLAAHLREAGR